MHGKGKYTWVDGPVFDGSFELNKIRGRGVYTWPGSGTYAGEVHPLPPLSSLPTAFSAR